MCTTSRNLSAKDLSAAGVEQTTARRATAVVSLSSSPADTSSARSKAKVYTGLETKEEKRSRSTAREKVNSAGGTTCDALPASGPGSRTP